MGHSTIFPRWCDTGGSNEKNSERRHFIDNEGSIVWNVVDQGGLPHYDHIEMSGYKVSCIISYGVDKNGNLRLHRHVVYPMLRKIPNNTHGSLSHNFEKDVSLKIKIGGKEISTEYPHIISIKGCVEISSKCDKGIEIIRKIIPSVNYQAAMEKVTVNNTSDKSISVDAMSPCYVFKTPPKKGAEGSYMLHANLADENGDYLSGKDCVISSKLEPGSSKSYYLVFSAARTNEEIKFNAIKEEQERENLIKEIWDSLVLETPDEILNTEFNHAKLRSCESIYKTKNGLMHSPGGGAFYAALWTNDQCEYMNPFFPFIGYEAGNNQSINCYQLFMKYMDSDYTKPLVSSIVAEGVDFWNGAGDRGDAAMYAYGASRFCLAYGNAETAQKLWPGIEWCIEFTKRKINKDGVVESDSDELENRFESGNANLFTSSIFYDALLSASMLACQLGKEEDLILKYQKLATDLKDAIENYFGANVEGYDTYRYYKENKVLRAWICIPLAMGIYDRSEDTIKALFSKRLWTENGLSTQAGERTFWDRSTLYALRGVFNAGKPDLALKYLTDYSRKRLLGEHVPYPVEAYPEGNQRHLAAESALYARIFTEGLFDIKPTGFRSFNLKPHLPTTWNRAALKAIKAFESSFDLEVTRVGRQIRVKVIEYDNLIYDKTSDESEIFEVVLKSN